MAFRSHVFITETVMQNKFEEFWNHFMICNAGAPAEMFPRFKEGGREAWDKTLYGDSEDTDNLLRMYEAILSAKKDTTNDYFNDIQDRLASKLGIGKAIIE